MSTNAYQIWLEANGQKLLLPVNPEKFDVKVNGNIQSVTIAELGEVLSPQAPKATVISFSSFFPAVSFTGCQYATAETTPSSVGDYNGDGKVDVRDMAAKARAEAKLGSSPVVSVASENTMKVIPHFCINFILSAMKSKKPVKLCITKCDIVRYMLVDSFSYAEGGLAVGDCSYSITFREYRTVTIKKIDVNKQTGKATVNSTPKRVSTAVKPKTYTVRSGDTIYAVAKKYYGDIADYRKIYEANKKQIGSNPNRIKAGMVLNLP